MQMVSLLSFLLTIFANTILGLIVFLQDPRKDANRFFGLLTLSLVLWIGSAFAYYSVTNPLWMLWAGRITFAFAVLIPLATYQFIAIFPTKLIQIPQRLSQFVYLASGIFFLLCLTPLVDTQEALQGASRITIYGPFYPLFLFEIITVCIIGIGVFMKKWQKAVGVERMQLLYFFLGFLSLFLLALFFNGIIPYFYDNSAFIPLGSLASIGFIGFTTYAIVRHKFMDINRIVVAVLEKLAVFVSLGVLYVIAVSIVGIVFFPKNFAGLDKRFLVIAIGTAVAIRLAIQPFGKYFQVVADTVLLRGLYSRKEILSEIQDISRTTVDLGTLIDSVLFTLNETMGISALTYISIFGETVQSNISVPSKKSISFKTKAEAQDLLEIKEPLVTDDVSKGELRKFLTAKKIAVVFPIQLTKEHKRFLLLGEKKNKDPYFQYDIQTLRRISQPLVIAIQNAQYLQDIQQFNKTLKKEVDHATKELRHVNAQLRHADKRKDEFISIASHELKTPTTAIQGFLWLVLQKDKKLSSYSRDKLERVAKLADQITTLVNDMLDVSRIESKRISLHPEEFDITNLAEEIKGELDLFAVQKRIAIRVNDTKQYAVWADRQRARQILTNLLYNAVKYTPAGGKVAVHFKQVDSTVEVIVKDTGIGIREEDLPRLFTKFGKLEDGNSISSHLPGTGLGLYITKNLVELSGGKISATSLYGKGSTFTFSLPVKEA